MTETRNDRRERQLSAAEARIEQALKAARQNFAVMRNLHAGGHYVRGSALGKAAIEEIIAILDTGKTKEPL